MSTLIKITAGAAVVAAGLGSLLAAAPAQADAKQDQNFYWLLTRPDRDNLTITNFPLVRAQGIAACQRQDAGEPPYQALKDLQYPRGPYTFSIANSITSAAEAVYCPWHIGTDGGSDWVNMSAPVDPRPTYPPIAWYPPVYVPAPVDSSSSTDSVPTDSVPTVAANHGMGTVAHRS